MNHRIVALLLVAFLVLVMPIWGWLDMRRLKRDHATAELTQSYLKTVGTMWLLTLVCALLIPARLLWTPPAGFATTMRVDAIPVSALIGLTIGLLIGLIVPVLIVRRKPGSADRHLEPIRFLLPVTVAQRWLFVLVCVTAGVAEEWIYRGFLLHYLASALPRLNGWWIVVIASVMFGIAHVYQGRTGTELTGILGFIFSVLYVGTGSLLLCMIVHTLVDLRIFLLLPELSRTQPA